MSLYALFLAITFNIHPYNKPDTIDYWHISYNLKTIAKYTAFDKAPVRIKRSAIKNDDMLSVIYADDTPGDTSHTGLYILRADKKRIMITTAKEGEPLKFYLNYILAIQSHHHLKNLNFYYFDDKRDHFIFRLLIE